VSASRVEVHPAIVMASRIVISTLRITGSLFTSRAQVQRERVDG
jgi:hypothetical protein